MGQTAGANKTVRMETRMGSRSPKYTELTAGSEPNDDIWIRTGDKQVCGVTSKGKGNEAVM